MEEKSIIFDLDGTLLYTLEDLQTAVNRALKSFNFKERTLEEVRNFVGNGVVLLMERAIPDGRNNPDFEACLNEFYKNYSSNVNEKTRPYDDIPETLDYLKSKGVRLAVNSNKYDAAVKDLCKIYFPQIEVAIGAREGIDIKPAPNGVNDILAFLHTNRANAFFIGDSSVDIQTAKNSGLKSIGVTWGYRTKASLVEAGADYIVDAPKEIIDIVLPANLI